jgi:ribosomal protein L29
MKTKELLKELRSLSYKELQERLLNVSRGMLNLRLKKSLNQPINPAEYKKLRRERARILTIMTQIRLGGKSEETQPNF